MLLTCHLHAQYTITGKLQDATNYSELPGAGVALLSLPDSNIVTGTVTDDAGNIKLWPVNNGNYVLQISYIGYLALFKSITINNSDMQLGLLQLKPAEQLLKQVNVEQYKARAEQIGDTTQYNASAFKTQQGASAEDLVTKMPGITSENGTLKTHGQDVKTVLVDGKPFFGNDVNVAMKNLPAEMVDKVQVYQKPSDQAAFTGFDDGNSQQTLNIVTRDGKNKGLFGKVYGGAGYLTDLRYNAGLNLNWFHKNTRLSAIAMSNNINQQNFSFQDILGVTNTQGPQFAGMFGGGPPPGAPKGPPPGGGSGPGANVANFLTQQLGGIATTHAVGLNYTSVWGKNQKVDVTGSYFFNYATTQNNSTLSRRYYSTTDTTQYYTEQATKNSTNINHRANIRLQYNIDSNNAIIFTPSFTYQYSKQSTTTAAQNSYNLSEVLNNINSISTGNNTGYNIAGDILYRHKFNKQGRTFSATLTNKYNAGNTANYLSSYVVNNSNSLVTNQKTTLLNNSYTLSGNLNYTEPVGKNHQLQFTYAPSATWSNANKAGYTADTNGEYTTTDTSLTNNYQSLYYTQKAGAAYMLRKGKVNFTLGTDFQYANLKGQQVTVGSTAIQKSFYSVLPNARFNYNISNASNLRLMYRSSTTAPTVNQLQNVVDNSNPTQLTIGNPNLKQSTTHTGILDVRYTNPKNGQTLFSMLNVNYTAGYIGKSQLTATADTLIQGITMATGSQLTQQVNLNNYVTANTFIAYGIPIARIKSNLNLNTGFNFASTPGLINGALNTSNTYAVNAGFYLGSNISDKIDFSINYSGTYTFVKNTLQPAADNNYFTHNAGLKVNWVFWRGFFVNTQLQNTYYNGISSGYNQNIFLWSAALGYKFLKDKALEVKVSVNDILNQNTGISRNVTETYIDDTRNTALKRYMLVTVTYNIAFKK